jgi:hypothetical protein
VIGKNATSLLTLSIFSTFFFFFFYPVSREHTTDQNGLALLAQLSLSLSLGSIAPSMGKRKNRLGNFDYPRFQFVSIRSNR